MKKTPILNELLSFKKENYSKFFMPSHLQLIFKNDFSPMQKKVFKIIKNFEKNTFSFDVTEVNNFDNLSNPNGIIKESQDIVAKSFNCNNAYFLVNGSTSGILSMICAVTKFNDKIIIQRNSHKSVYNACEINNLSIVYIENEKNLNFDIDRKLNIIEFENLLKKNSDAKAVVITSPDYYGQYLDVQKLAEIAHRYSMYILVDCAHGANYNYSRKFPRFPIEYADMTVTSFHKTLPCINQTAVLFTSRNLSNEIKFKLREKINIFQTTSPSYILLSNIELSNYLLNKYGAILYEDLYENIKKFKKKIFKLSEKNNKIKIFSNDDFSRLVISFRNMNINYIYDYLKNNKILPEMINKKSIVFICNIFHTKKDFDNLYFILRSIIKNKELNNDVNKYNNKNLYKTHKNLVVLKYVEENIGKNSDYNIYLYPPGTPFIIKNELITEEIVDKLKRIDIDKNIEIIF